MPTQRSFRVALACWALLLCFVCAFYRVRTFDTFFHLATGRFIIEHGFVPDRDPFSFTFRGAPWLNHSWGFQWGLASLQGSLGFSAISWLQGTCALVLSALALAPLRRRAELTVAGSLLVALPALAFREVLEARPHLVGFCALAASLSILLAVQAGAARRASLLALVPVYAVWVTCHGSHLLALMLVALLAATAAAGRDLRTLGVLGVTALCMLALLAWLAPHAFAQGGEHLASEFLESSVEEWYPVSFSELLAHPAGRVFLALFLAALLGAARALRERPSGIVCTPFALASLGLFMLLSFTSRRMLALFAFGAAPLWLPYAALLVQRAARAVSVHVALQTAAPVAVLGLFSALPFAFPGPFVVGAGLSDGRFPSRAVDALAREGRVRRLYNAYNFGGYLMWRRFPEAGVFVDGRAITVYPAAFLAAFDRAYDDPRAFEALVRVYAVDAVLMPTRSARVQRLRAYLSASPRWQKTFEDEVAFAFERR